MATALFATFQRNFHAHIYFARKTREQILCLVPVYVVSDIRTQCREPSRSEHELSNPVQWVMLSTVHWDQSLPNTSIACSIFKPKTSPSRPSCKSVTIWPKLNEIARSQWGMHTGSLIRFQYLEVILYTGDHHHIQYKLHEERRF